MWLRAFVVQGWLAFGLVFADAIDPDFDIAPALLNILGVIVIAGMLASILLLRDERN